MDQDLLRARYGDDIPEAAALNDVLRLLINHRSCRHFTNEPLPPGLIEALIAAAQSAATSSNTQTFSVVVVEDAARRARLAELSNRQAFIAQAPVFLCWVADSSRLYRMGERHQQKLEGLDYLESFIVAAVDAALAAQNCVIAAESMGLGTVYVGGLRSKPEDVARELALPPGAVALFGMSMGWPDPVRENAIKPRLPQQLVLHREQYGVAGEAEAVARYDQALAAFSESQGMGPQAWTPRMLSRVGTPQALSGRHRMVEMLRNLGFPLK